MILSEKITFFSTNGCIERIIGFHRIVGETVDWLRNMIETQNNLDVKSSFTTFFQKRLILVYYWQVDDFTNQHVVII